MELQFQVKNQRLYLNTVNQVVADSKNYLTATFTFTDDWDGATKVAQFTRGTTTTNVTITNGSCTVPQSVLAGEGEFFISVYGSINNMATIITANAVKIAVLPSGFVANAGTISQADAAALQAHADAVTAVVNNSTASVGGYAKEVVFTVRGQSMYLTSRGKVVADSQGYLGAKFLFSDDWADTIKIAQFKRGDLFFSIMLDSDGTCTIPWEVLVDEGTFVVSVFGNNRPDEENKIITVNPVEVRVEKSGLTDGELPSNPTYGIDGSTLYEITLYASRAEAAASTATTAKNQAQGYASDASESADSASASASAAAQSATSASNSATSAANSATAAANAQQVVENYASGFAPLTSPVFDGIPTAPTAMVGTDTDQIATTAFVQAELEDYATLLDLDDYVELTSSGYIKSASVSGDTLTLTRGDDTTVTYTPDIPTKVSDLTNDAGYITGVDWDDVGDKPTFATVATSGSYNDLSNKPTIPTVPTNISAFTNDSGYATTAYVDAAAANAVSDLVESAPTTLDTLEELANALGDDPNFATTIATQIGAKADKTYVDNNYLPLAGGTMTGTINSHTNANCDATSSTRVEEVLSQGKDKNGLSLGSEFYSAVNTDIFHGIRATNPNYNSGTNWADIRLHVGTDGKRYITTDYHSSLTDGTTDNSNHVPTTAFIHSKYLSLSGGTLTGHLLTSGNIYKNADNSVLSLNGGSNGSSGAYLNLYGKSHAESAGAFSLTAFDGTTRKQLIGLVNGNLTWAGTAISLNGHTHSDYLPTNGNAASATKLNTARNISAGNLDFVGSANFDGTGNITLNAAPYNAKISIGNKNNYPYHYIGTTGIVTGSYVDKVITLLVTKDNINGGAGIVRIEFRADNASNGALAACRAIWLLKDEKLPTDCIQVGFRNVAGDSIADIFYKSNGAYASAVVRTMQNGIRGSISRAFTLVDSSEVSNTTTTDKLTSVGAYAAINDAVADLHAGKTYTSIITADDTSYFTGQLVVNRSNTSVGGGIKLTGAGQNYIMSALNTNVTKGTAPSATQYWGIDFYGKDITNYNQRVGMLETTLNANNVATTAIRAYNCTTNTNTNNCTISVNVDGSGNAYTAAPTPATADNSTKIATTAFVKNQGYITSAGTATNVSGTVAIANGGTGQTTRLNALKALTNENVGTNATYFLTITNSWGKGGYTSVADAKTVLGLGSAAYTDSTAYATSGHTHSYLPLSGGTLTGNETISKSQPTIILKDTVIARNTAPSANYAIVEIDSKDKNNNRTWGLYHRYSTDKSNRIDLIVYKGNTTDSTWSAIGVGYDKDGNWFTYAPTPAQTSNSTVIATTAHVKACVPKSVGSATQPVYTDSNGVITACTYTLGKSVPSNAVFTDTNNISATGTNYIRFNNSRQICWGANSVARTTSTNVTFPVAFSASPTFILGGYQGSVFFSSLSSTKVSLTNSEDSNTTIYWLAIGSWS